MTKIVLGLVLMIGASVPAIIVIKADAARKLSLTTALYVTVSAVAVIMLLGGAFLMDEGQADMRFEQVEKVIYSFVEQTES